LPEVDNITQKESNVLLKENNASQKVNNVLPKLSNTPPTKNTAERIRDVNQSLNLTLCKRNAFSTTDTELNAIAAPATHGASNPAAAIGIPTEL
jgi:hypothetical protein